MFDIDLFTGGETRHFIHERQACCQHSHDTTARKFCRFDISNKMLVTFFNKKQQNVVVRATALRFFTNQCQIGLEKRTKIRPIFHKNKGKIIHPSSRQFARELFNLTNGFDTADDNLGRWIKMK